MWHLALVGLRRGELCGLPWTDIAFQVQTISIEITRVVVDGEVVEGDTKPETSTRVLPLTPELLALRAATRMQAEEQLAAGPAFERSGYVVVDPWGGATTSTRCRTPGRQRVRSATHPGSSTARARRRLRPRRSRRLQ